MPQPVTATRPPAILLIDDDATGVAIRSRVLQSAGYGVHVALTGRAGLDLLHREIVDLVVLDYHLPDFNGDAILAAIQQLDHSLPVILLSGILGVEEMAGRPDAILVKGEGPVVLLETIHRLFDRSSHPAT